MSVIPNQRNRRKTSKIRYMFKNVSPVEMRGANGAQRDRVVAVALLVPDES